MKRLGTIELAKKKMAMRVRAMLRLKAQEQYLDELNEMLPAAEILFDKKVQQGRLPKPVDVSKVLSE
jgi:hypothetical protein